MNKKLEKERQKKKKCDRERERKSRKNCRDKYGQFLKEIQEIIKVFNHVLWQKNKLSQEFQGN